MGTIYVCVTNLPFGRGGRSLFSGLPAVALVKFPADGSINSTKRPILVAAVIGITLVLPANHVPLRPKRIDHIHLCIFIATKALNSSAQRQAIVVKLTGSTCSTS